MYRRALPCLLVAALSCGRAAAAADGSGAYETLRAAPRFAMGGVGYAGAISREEQALRTSLERPTAAADLQRLVAEATLEGRLYALLGLKLLEHPSFDALVRPYLRSHENVRTMVGCMVDRATAATIARRIRRGDYR